MIDQEQYMIQILSDFGMEHCNLAKTPCPTFCLTITMCPKRDNEC